MTKEELLIELDNKQSLTYRKLYPVWNGIKQRCRNPKDSRYCKYGAKGIAMSDKWHDDFKEFASWAIYNDYIPQEGKLTSSTMTIDRINPDLGYSVTNCRVITHGENSGLSRSKVVPVHVYDCVNGKYIYSYASSTDACSKLGLNNSHLSECLSPNGTRTSHKGYMFSLIKVKSMVVPKTGKITNKDIVATCVKDGSTKVFKRVKDISDEYGIPTTNVSKVLRGKRKTAKGFTFKYVEY